MCISWCEINNFNVHSISISKKKKENKTYLNYEAQKGHALYGKNPCTLPESHATHQRTQQTNAQFLTKKQMTHIVTATLETAKSSSRKT
jgi:hypothetical protein